LALAVITINIPVLALVLMGIVLCLWLLFVIGRRF